MLNTSEEEAKAHALSKNEKSYKTTVACKNGHLELRSVKYGYCLTCRKHYKRARTEKSSAEFKKWYAKNREKNIARVREWAKNNPDKVKMHEKERYKKRRASISARAMKWNRDNKDRHRATHKRWRSKNKSSLAFFAAVRRATKLKATPSWLTPEHKSKIKDFYATAQMLNQHLQCRYEVDHIVPLMGETVCGLHVPWNLQILEQSVNRAKSNHLEGKEFK